MVSSSSESIWQDVRLLVSEFVHRRHRPTSLRRTVVQAVVPPLVALTVFAMLILQQGGVTDVRVVPLKPLPAQITPEEPPLEAISSRAIDALMEKYNCWSGEAPQKVLPTRVVYSQAPHREVKLGQDRLVAKSLDQIFHGKPAGLKIYGFCP